MAALLTLISIDAAAAPTTEPPNCPRRELKPEVAAIAKNVAMMSMLLQGATAYAGDGPAPRPLPQTTLHDLQEEWQQLAPPGILAFTFVLGNAESGHRNILSVPKSAGFCLLKPGDTLLLWDRITAHYTSLHGFDTESDAVYLSDPWPDTIFLLPGRNAAGVKAVNEKLGNRTLTRVRREEILGVLTGVITFDTLDLVQHYVTTEPGARSDPRVFLAFGSTVLDATRLSAQRPLRPHAVQMLEMAVRLARDRQEPALVETAESVLALALSYERLDALQRNDTSVVKEAELKLGLLRKLPGGDRIESRWTTDDWYGLGLAAGNAQEYAASIRFFDEAIRARADFAAAYLWRANSRLRSDQAIVALDDVKTALTLIRREKAVLNGVNSASAPEDKFAEAKRTSRLAQLDEMERAGAEIERLALARRDP